MQTSFLIFVILVSFIIRSERRGAIALILIESLEAHRLLQFCKEHDIDKIYYFCIFEKDANILAILLQNSQIEVHKIPSEVPLSYWNKTIVADVLCVCFAYQFDELKEYKNSIFIGKTEFWGPEQMLDVAEKYLKIQHNKTLNTIGFYSTASWVREKEGHMDQGSRMLENEHLVKSYLKNYLRQDQNNTQLTVFLHPKEKSTKYYKKSVDHYKKYFHGTNYIINPVEESTAENFEKINIAIAFSSTIIYERLFFGFKSVILPMFKKGFPLNSSELKNICAYSQEEMNELIELNLNITDCEFFQKHSLMSYVSNHIDLKNKCAEY